MITLYAMINPNSRPMWHVAVIHNTFPPVHIGKQTYGNNNNMPQQCNAKNNKSNVHIKNNIIDTVNICWA